MSVTAYLINKTVGAVDQFLTNTVIDPDESRVGKTLLVIVLMGVTVMSALSMLAVVAGVIFGSFFISVLIGSFFNSFAVVPLVVARFIILSVMLVLCVVVIIGVAVGLAAPRNQPV